MNGPDLHLIRRDLKGAVARQGKPPTLRPMDASPWVAMSAMQKAIRRGREDLALSAAGPCSGTRQTSYGATDPADTSSMRKPCSYLQ